MTGRIFVDVGDVMNEKIFEQLEYTRIKDTIASFCVSEDRRNAFTEIKPISDDKKIAQKKELENN